MANELLSAPDYQLTLHLTNKEEQLSELAEEVELFGAEVKWSDAEIMQINLVLEELILNTIHYGYHDGRDGFIDVLIKSYDQEIGISLIDDGDPFDPFQVETPDLSLSIAERSIGGLGIHLVRCYMDSYSYHFTNGCNHISLSKRRR